ncbi:MAG: ATP-binding protein [Syntrophales bacterium]|jgi:PAS domain S-box-containing protein
MKPVRPINSFNNGEPMFRRIIMECSPIPTFVIDREHRVIFWNQALAELSKIRMEEVVGKRLHWRAFYDTERPCMADLLVDGSHDIIPKWYVGKYIKSNLIEEAYEATDFFPALGERGRWLRFTAATIRNNHGEIIGAVETLEDVTEKKIAEEALIKAHEQLEARVQKRTMELTKANEALQNELVERWKAEEALQETTDQLSLILESLPIVSFTCNRREPYATTFVSSTIEEITGYKPQQFLEIPSFWQDHIHPDDRTRVLSELAQSFEGIHQSEYRFQAADRAYKWFSDYRRPVHLPDQFKSHFIGTWKDITEDKRIRQEGELHLQQLIQSHKLTALGEVVAGVAHEINNPVSFISHNIPLLEEMWNAIEPILASDGATHPDWGERGISYVEVSTNMREIIEEFKIASQRIKRVVTGLKEFARLDDMAQKKPVQISDVIEGALIIVGAQVRKTVSKIDQYIDSNIPPIQGHFQKIEQVIANLLINAHQAIPSDRKGRIIITARYLERLRGIVIEIEDNGRGMEKDVLDHIFDPFFTTRRDHDGTGLGLSISYGLIREHNGRIGVLTKPGVGSHFIVYIPVDGEKSLTIHPSILCIGRDKAFLEEIKMNFVDACILPAVRNNSPEKYMTFLEEHPEVDVVLAGVQLSARKGWDLWRKIHHRFPLITVIFYGQELAVPDEEADCDRPYLLKKPFSLKQLQDIIEDAGRLHL